MNHFDISGFFKLNEKLAYFSIGDLRWDKDDMLIRVARNEEDYTGERNNYISLESSKGFILGMERFLKDNKYENFTNCKVVGNINDTNFSMQNLRDTLMKESKSVT